MNRSMTLRRLRLISRWTYLVLERGPLSAGPEARRLIGLVSGSIRSFDNDFETEMSLARSRGGSFHVSEVEAQVSRVYMDRLAREVAWLCTNYVIQAPPGLHARLMRSRKRYRAQAPYMSVFIGRDEA
jgi:hypothetical protein